MARTGAAADKPSVSYRGLRGWLEQVDKLGELERVNGASWDVEMGALTQMLTEKSGGTAPAILFDNVPGYPKGYRTLYGQLLIDQTHRADARSAARAGAQGRHRAALSRSACRI